MNLRSLSLDGWRNYARSSADFLPGVNVVYGDNAQGKTNLVEAVTYLSLGRSRRTRGDRELIGLGREDALLTAVMESRGREFTVEARLRRGVRRRFTINGVPCKNAGELASVLRTVFFCPDDLAIVKDSAVVRRRFIDDALCQLRPRYAAALAEHRRLYEHKSCILRRGGEKPALLDTLDDFNLRLCRVGAILLHFRAQFVRSIAERARAIHSDFSGGAEELTIQYRTVRTVTNPLCSAEELFPLLVEHQRSRRAEEIESRLCLSGVHKDDMEMEINGRSARAFASQGQARTAALSLKLAEREVHFADTGQYPVLLLDDVLSELDPRRQEFVLSRIGGGQVLITCCDPRGLECTGKALIPAGLIHIEGGAIV